MAVSFASLSPLLHLLAVAAAARTKELWRDTARSHLRLLLATVCHLLPPNNLLMVVGPAYQPPRGTTLPILMPLACPQPPPTSCPAVPSWCSSPARLNRVVGDCSQRQPRRASVLKKTKRREDARSAPAWRLLDERVISTSLLLGVHLLGELCVIMVNERCTSFC